MDAYNTYNDKNIIATDKTYKSVCENIQQIFDDWLNSAGYENARKLMIEKAYMSIWDKYINTDLEVTNFSFERSEQQDSYGDIAYNKERFCAVLATPDNSIKLEFESLDKYGNETIDDAMSLIHNDIIDRKIQGIKDILTDYVARMENMIKRCEDMKIPVVSERYQFNRLRDYLVPIEDEQTLEDISSPELASIFGKKVFAINFYLSKDKNLQYVDADNEKWLGYTSLYKKQKEIAEALGLSMYDYAIVDYIKSVNRKIIEIDIDDELKDLIQSIHQSDYYKEKEHLYNTTYHEVDKYVEEHEHNQDEVER